MQKSYKKNYLKIYFYQILSIVLGFLSLFIVIPYLSSDKTIYGIYSICIAITIFLNYADLGFLGAGMKFAAESFSRDDKKDEIEIIGFSNFILLVFIILLSLVFFLLSFNPEFLITNIKSGKETEIAHSLLLILAIFSPTVVVQRCLQIIYGIRLEDYVLQRINIIGNLLKIISVYYFFGNANYNIVGYFLFVQVINLICAIIGVIWAKKKYYYDFKGLMTQFRFKRHIFLKVKNLAFSGLAVTISWILYYELDSFFIGKFLGSDFVAIYAIGFTILTFFRSLLGIFFSPFSARFNHFIGQGKIEELKNFYVHLLIIAFPIVVFPIIGVVYYSYPLVISWVGGDYEKSVPIVQWLVLCNILAFVSYPAGMIMIAMEKIKEMQFLSFLMPVIYWIGIIATIHVLGLTSFAIFKFIAFAVSGAIYLIFSLKFINISCLNFIKKVVLPYLPGLLLLVLFLYFMKNIAIPEKSKLSLFYSAMIIAISLSIAFITSLFTVKYLREYFFKIVKVLKKNN